MFTMLVIVFKNGEIEVTCENSLSRSTCHNLKSLAGKRINQDDVKSVKVFRSTGEVFFYMIKDDFNHVTHSEIISSEVLPL